MNNNIKDIISNLKDNGVKMKELLDKNRIPLGTFYDISNGKQVPRLDTAYKIVNALGFKDEEITKVFPNIYNQKNS